MTEDTLARELKEDGGPRAGSGYLTAVMGELVGERGRVLGVERHAEVCISRLCVGVCWVSSWVGMGTCGALSKVHSLVIVYAHIRCMLGFAC